MISSKPIYLPGPFNMLSRLVIAFLPRSKHFFFFNFMAAITICNDFGAPENKLDKLDQTRQDIENQRHYFDNKGPSSQNYGFSSSHVWMWELDYKESWEPNNWCFWTVVLEKTLKSLLDCKEIQPVHRKGNNSLRFIERTDVEAETAGLWPPDVKNWLIWKDPHAGKDWSWEEIGMTMVEMVGWYHRLNGHEFEQTPGDSEEQGSLVCFSP